MSRKQLFILIPILLFILGGLFVPEAAFAQMGVRSSVGTDELLGVVGDALLSPVGWLAIIILKIASILVYLAGAILNMIVKFSIVDMRQHVENAGTINAAWSAIRDIANMGFIFILLYAAIKTILGLGSDTQKLIRNVIIVAILINFSLFFTKVVIDISNVLAIYLYDAIAPGSLQVNATVGLSNSLMAPLDLQTIFDATGDNILNGSKLITIGIMGTIVVLITAFVFFAMSIMLVIRLVVLIFVMILSPIAFLGFILPATERYKNQWKDALLGQAFFAPIFFLMIWIVIMVSRGLLTGGAAMSEALSGTLDANGQPQPPSDITTLLNFIILIVLMIASLIISKQWANKAGPAATTATRWLAGATIGTAAFAGRNTLGRVAERFQRSEAYSRLEARSPDSARARLALAAIDKTRAGSFDLRSGSVGKAMSATGVEYDSTFKREGGFEAGRKARREFFEAPGTESRKKRLERGRQAQNELDLLAGGAQLEQALTNMTAKEVEAIIDSNKQLLNSMEFANNLSEKQLVAINESDKFSEQEKQQLKNLRFVDVGNPAGLAALAIPEIRRTPQQKTDADNLRAAARGLSVKELEMIDPTLLGNADFVSQLKTSQYDDIMKSDKFTKTQKGQLRTARQAPLMRVIGQPFTNQATIDDAKKAVRELNHKEIASLSLANLSHPTMLQVYTPELLRRMAPEMNPADIQPLRTLLETGGNQQVRDWLTHPDGRGAIFS